MKRCLSICCVFAMALGLSFGVSTDTQAASSVKVIDGSQLTKDAESIGYTQKVARGEDLLTGYSKIVRMGPGRIYAGGTTIAERVVDRVGIAVMNRRKKKIRNGRFMILGRSSMKTLIVHHLRSI